MKNWEYFMDGIEGYEQEARRGGEKIESIGEERGKEKSEFQVLLLFVQLEN